MPDPPGKTEVNNPDLVPNDDRPLPHAHSPGILVESDSHPYFGLSMLGSLLARLRPTKPTIDERCAACPLTACVRGDRAAVVRMECENEEARRLRNLGLFEGSCVTVIDRQDGCLLDVRGARLALAAQLADSITVLPMTR